MTFNIANTYYLMVKKRNNINALLFKITNLALRGVSILSRFGLLLFMSKYLTTNQLGDFSLFNTSIMISYMILGWDFYMYSSRKLIGTKNRVKVKYITNQLYFYLGFYILILPILVFAIYYFGLPFSNAKYFLVILILEHLGQELFRLLIALKKPFLANVSFFIRSSIWVIIMLLLHYTNIVIISRLELIYQYWVVGSSINVIIFAYYIVFSLKLVRLKKPNIKWIKEGFIIASYFFASTMAFKIVEFSNRYILDWKTTKSEVGIYSLFSQIASLINVFVFTFTIMYLYPKLIEAYKSNNMIAFDLIKKDMFKQIMLITGLLSLIIIITIDPVLLIIDKPEISQNKSILYILLAANFLLSLSFIPNYHLFAFGKDKLILISSVSSAIFVLVFGILLISYYGILGAAISLLSGYLVLFLSKLYYTTNLRLDEK